MLSGATVVAVGQFYVGDNFVRSALDRVIDTVSSRLSGFGGKTVREIFDTEYDNGKVFCGMFDG